MSEILSTDLRRRLERTVVEAREGAEAGARAALEALAVGHREPFDHMTAEQRTLRTRLRAHGRQLGDRRDARTGDQAVDHLVHEGAYEHWHRMLFARFLAESDLLIEPETEVAISLAECEDLAREEGTDPWTLAGRFAQRMLPQVFRADHPALEVTFAREHRVKLEQLLAGLPAEVFRASDALGWVYQFWQTKRKKEVNESETKIGGEELPAVTELFTEPYMVQFLLHNSLGAWWMTRHPDRSCPVELRYLRTLDDGTPAAGSFEGWPDDLAEFRMLDPCCGSGHFLVTAFHMLVPMRMALEGFSARDAIDAVLRENLHGLELDRRCVEIAAFALALEAWRYPGAGGYRPLPDFHLAWSGQPVTAKKAEWLKLANGDERLRAGLSALHDAFREAPLLGSLLDPRRAVEGDLFTSGFDELAALLDAALEVHRGEPDREESAIAARDLAVAADLLTRRYQLVATNVPYLSRGRQTQALRDFCARRYTEAKNDLANVFLERCLELTADGGVTQIVMPQNWLFLTRYRKQRERLLSEVTWVLLARLGPGAFETISGEVVNVILLNLTRARPDAEHLLRAVDASGETVVSLKANAVATYELNASPQRQYLVQPESRITAKLTSASSLLSEYATTQLGVVSGDSGRWIRQFWETNLQFEGWEYLQSTVTETTHYGGRSQVIDWRTRGRGMLRPGADNPAFGQLGVLVSQMHDLPATLYTGHLYDNNSSAIVPETLSDLAAIWSFCSSSEYGSSVRNIDQKVGVVNASLLRVEFARERWIAQANSDYPRGLPRPYSDDPAQWLFHGHPKPCAYGPAREPPWPAPGGSFSKGEISESGAYMCLQVAVARLLGYRWPAESDTEMELADEARAWIAEAAKLDAFADRDGIVCIAAMRGAAPAAERLRELLRAAFGDDWAPDLERRLIVASGSKATDLDGWLRDDFFSQHCGLFHQRPLIWHVWDGRRRDGFHALVNYHRLAEGESKGRRVLESFTYSALGDWIARLRDELKRGAAGSDDRLAAAMELHRRLEAILQGEPPFDLFVRWKPIAEQPIGWEPDIDDGVRLNVRPFMADDLANGRKGAGILRAKPKVHWRKDRGKEPFREREHFPWFWRNGEFTGDRVNDVHLTLDEKRAARNATGSTAAAD